MATPRVAAGALIRNSAGEILLVKPTYKDGWEIPGGYVEPGESPRAACIREIREELGVDHPVGNLLVVDWAPAEQEGDKLLFIFDASHVELSALTLPPDELSEAKYWPAGLITSVTPPRLGRRILAAARADQGHLGTYLEHGTA
ncbi:NUDIX domain-containing protein [Nocardioides jejuensis]|nr:NUDIX hydrolase [Nocardioides jejuensis]